jgi:molecular chaperone GrpE
MAEPKPNEQGKAKPDQKEDVQPEQVDGEPTSQDIHSTKVESPPRKPVTIEITDIQLEQLKQEMAEYKDKYLRLLAESENMRKRLQKERQELIQYAVQNVIIDFLNPIDHLENALNYTQQASGEVKQWAAGFQMILGQFKDVLTNNGIVSFVSVGTPFDPHSHEAIEMIATTAYPPGTVAEESLKGYKMGDRVIRPARVKVAKLFPPSPKPEVPQDENAEQINS